MNNNVLKIAAEILKTDVETVRNHSREIPELDAYYFWIPVRGGLAVIINKDGEKLAATSGVNYEKHLEAFINGRRN